MEGKSMLWYVWESSTAGGGGSTTFFEVVLRWPAVASTHRESESLLPSAALGGPLQPRGCPERSTSVWLTSPVSDVRAVKAHALLLVKDERVLQQVPWEERVSTQSGEDKEQRAAHPPCIRASAAVPRLLPPERIPKKQPAHNLVFVVLR